MALLGGKPLVQWAIEAAQQACDEVFVVTDRYGRDIVDRRFPGHRPASLVSR
jgi:GTP:adenosylcobinamide-phosphate guanylyltransferase